MFLLEQSVQSLHPIPTVLEQFFTRKKPERHTHELRDMRRCAQVDLFESKLQLQENTH